MAATAPFCRRHASAQTIAKPAAIAGDLRREEREADPEHRRQRERPQPVDEDPARVLLRERRGGARAARAAARSAGSSRARRPSQVPTATARTHQPATTNTSSESASAPAASTVTTASAVAAPALRITVALRKSTKRTAGGYSSASSSCRTPAVPSTSVSAASSSSRGVSSERTPTHAAVPSLPCSTSVAQAVERVDVGRGRRPRTPRPSGRASRSRRRMPRPLSMSTAGRTSSTLRPQCVRRPAASARSATLAHGPLRGRPRPARRASGTPRSARLSSARTRRRRSSSPYGVVGEPPDAPLPGRDLAIELDLGPARAQQLDAVVADVGDRPDGDDLPRDRGLAAAHAGDASVAARHLDQQRARRLGDRRVIGVADDRSERPVHVEQDAGACRIRPERLECLAQRRGGGHGRSMARPGDDRWSCGTGYPQVGRGRPRDPG